jgi:hypothetical protein
VTALLPLARLPIARLTRTPRAWAGTAAWTALALGMALFERSRGASHGADEVLTLAFGSLVMPLVAFVLAGAAVGGRSLAGSTVAVVSLGASPARAAAAGVVASLASAALVSALLAVAVDALAHGSADPPLARDLRVTAYVAALGGACYGAWFALGASFGRRGGGRIAFLVLDWVVGSWGGSAAVLSPRAHVRNLLGAAAPVGITQRASAVALAVLTLAYLLVAVGRARRRY